MVEAYFQPLRLNAVSALTELPAQLSFALEKEFTDLGYPSSRFDRRSKQVAAGLGVKLHEDPWEMNKIGARTDHPPSMLL